MIPLRVLQEYDKFYLSSEDLTEYRRIRHQWVNGKGYCNIQNVLSHEKSFLPLHTDVLPKTDAWTHRRRPVDRNRK